ncbi:beta-galactosidase GalA [Mucilaginibacter dorajii]|nr:beta-galactosidase GalA [Mucilaginibacter dorajii]MCS3732322.1 beta-galactosidase [Mucilaginibacter dorajii]
MFAILFLLKPFSIKAQTSSNTALPKKFSLNKGWKFHLGDVEFPVVRGHYMSYANAKAGTAWGAAAPDYDDHNWRTLTLPHDWASEQPFDSTANLSQGYRNRGFGWYRRQFKLDSTDRGKYLELQFEGIATYATIWVNGLLVHRNWCGYTSSYIDITPFAKYGDQVNTIAIRVDANAQEGWWYEGAGIYRNTWLIKRESVHIITDGVYANPVKTGATTWTIPGEITIENSGNDTRQVDLEMSLYTPDLKLLTTGHSSIDIKPLCKKASNITLNYSDPRLWSVSIPTLYYVKTIIKIDSQIVDSLITKCGFRTIKFDADSGFYLNNQRLKLQGVCNHQDHAGVGVAVPDSIVAFRLRKLKEMGVNAYRCAHNPPSVQFLNLCDEMGIMVMDENRNFNSSPEYVRQLQWMVRRDRNHPSVILWSVFNEEPMQGSEIGYQMVRRMSHTVKELDTTRPVTAAMNGGLFDPVNVSQAVDVVGFNYQSYAYDRFHKENPTTALTSSEDVSGFMTRGAFTTNKAKHILDSYDTQYAMWGTSQRKGWKLIAERPFIAGNFIWSGFDYHGEPSPFGWPSASSFFGLMDLCGFPKMAYYLHQAQWIKDKPVLHLIPHWNWPADSIGKKIKVMVLSNVESVKLYLNGQLLGEQKVDPYEMNTWMIPYQPGTLKAVGFAKNKQIATDLVATTGDAVSVRISTDRLFINGDGLDALPITVEALDTKGRHVPNASDHIKFTLTGPARIIGLGNGDPNSHEPEKGDQRSLFNGLAQVIIQSNEVNKDTQVTLHAIAKGLKPFVLKIPVKAGRPLLYAPVISSTLLIDKWLMSPMTDQKPDPDQVIAENDMNSWQPTSTGKLTTLTAQYVIFRSSLSKPLANVEKAHLLLKKAAGKAKVYIDGHLAYQKIDQEPADISIEIEQAQLVKQISVLFEGKAGDRIGIMGTVELK